MAVTNYRDQNKINLMDPSWKLLELTINLS